MKLYHKVPSLTPSKKEGMDWFLGVVIETIHGYMVKKVPLWFWSKTYPLSNILLPYNFRGVSNWNIVSLKRVFDLCGRIKPAILCIYYFISVGVHYWTIGQRTLICGLDKAYFVSSMDPVTQNIYVVSFYLGIAISSFDWLVF